MKPIRSNRGHREWHSLSNYSYKFYNFYSRKLALIEYKRNS